jgi:hypothetical protein
VFCVFGVVVVDDEDELVDEDEEELVDEDEDEVDVLEAVPIRIVTVEPFVRSEPPGGDWVSTRPTLDGSVTGRVFVWATSPAA